jgi:hypothetical protein
MEMHVQEGEIDCYFRWCAVACEHVYVYIYVYIYISPYHIDIYVLDSRLLSDEGIAYSACVGLAAPPRNATQRMHAHQLHTRSSTSLSSSPTQEGVHLITARRCNAHVSLQNHIPTPVSPHGTACSITRVHDTQRPSH